MDNYKNIHRASSTIRIMCETLNSDQLMQIAIKLSRVISRISACLRAHVDEMDDTVLTIIRMGTQFATDAYCILEVLMPTASSDKVSSFLSVENYVRSNVDEFLDVVSHYDNILQNQN